MDLLGRRAKAQLRQIDTVLRVEIPEAKGNTLPDRVSEALSILRLRATGAEARANHAMKMLERRTAPLITPTMTTLGARSGRIETLPRPQVSRHSAPAPTEAPRRYDSESPDPIDVLSGLAAIATSHVAPAPRPDSFSSGGGGDYGGGGATGSWDSGSSSSDSSSSSSSSSD
jgi:hypothetical protein